MQKSNLNEHSTFYASSYLVDELKEKYQGTEIYNFAFTDYGGSFLDLVCIEYFKKNYPKNIVFEQTRWNGMNAFIFGNIVTEFIESSESYILGFENIESFYYELEDKKNVRIF